MGESLNNDALELSLANDLSEIPAAAERIEEFCAARELTPKVAYAANLAIDEILTNTISYGYGYDDDEAHRIELTLRVDGDRLIVVIEDDGREFDSSMEREPELETSLEERALGGLGLFLAHQMMDDVAYQRRDSCNIITLTKSTVEKADS